MKAVILAGGTASRMRPLTDVTNKHLLPVGQAPMIYHPIGQFKRAGLREILIVTGRNHMGHMVEQLGSGRQFGVEFTFKVQDEAGGIAQALGIARGFAGGEAVAVHLGDNIFEDEIAPFVREYIDAGEKGAMIFLKEVADPHRFGVAETDAEGRVLSIEEKPANPKSALAVTGLYFYENSVFDIIPTLNPSHRGELEITDVNNYFIKAGAVRSRTLKGYWTDAGTFDSWKRANELAWDKNFSDLFSKE